VDILVGIVFYENAKKSLIQYSGVTVSIPEVVTS